MLHIADEMHTDILVSFRCGCLIAITRGESSPQRVQCGEAMWWYFTTLHDDVVMFHHIARRCGEISPHCHAMWWNFTTLHDNVVTMSWFVVISPHCTVDVVRLPHCIVFSQCVDVTTAITWNVVMSPHHFTMWWHQHTLRCGDINTPYNVVTSPHCITAQKKAFWHMQQWCSVVAHCTREHTTLVRKRHKKWRQIIGDFECWIIGNF